MQYKYTICFIKRGHQLLMLNREKPEWMGVWNGVGGKIEKGETPEAAIIREIKEETGIDIGHVAYKGTVTWSVNESYIGGMYAFVAELPETYEYHTPIKTQEGILDWKDLSWILHPENVGMANVKFFLHKMLDDYRIYDHQFIYIDGEVVDFHSERLDTSTVLH
ncbi:8-oxo-dGTP diphosphatase [Heyndrickxia sp. FSL K6-6286]|uniref:NUDIX hydrolase n=1 Tax=Heyndrickxia sp. FSL K6-6286 TaxID=2921510 RepID=UPI0015D3D54E|nr:8-oxo-dGTP diphosphatase [Heyndrickxia oleronia]NYV63961.1 8-oxo-dGTP diphosphatase [Bacillus sp. Gen3]